MKQNKSLRIELQAHLNASHENAAKFAQGRTDYVGFNNQRTVLIAEKLGGEQPSEMLVAISKPIVVILIVLGLLHALNLSEVILGLINPSDTAEGAVIAWFVVAICGIGLTLTSSIAGFLFADSFSISQTTGKINIDHPKIIAAVFLFSAIVSADYFIITSDMDGKVGVILSFTVIEFISGVVISWAELYDVKKLLSLDKHLLECGRNINLSARNCYESYTLYLAALEQHNSINDMKIEKEGSPRIHSAISYYLGTNENHNPTEHHPEPDNTANSPQPKTQPVIDTENNPVLNEFINSSTSNDLTI